MTRKRLLNILALLILLVALLHGVALGYGFYLNLPGFDKVPHFLGGVFVALLIFWFCFFSGYLSVRMPRPFGFFLLIVGGTFLVGIGWEVFEYVIGMLWTPGGYWFDTLTDVLADTVGALAGYWYLRMAGRSILEK